MEERHGEQRRSSAARSGPAPGSARRAAGSCAPPANMAPPWILQVPVAVRAERALRLAGGARRVEDRRVVLGPDLDGRQARSGSLPQSCGRTDRRPRARRTRGSALSSGARATKTRSRAGQFGRCSWMRSSRSASTIATLVPESTRPYSSSRPVHQALSGRGDGAGEQRAEERHRPLRQVAHERRRRGRPCARRRPMSACGDREGGAREGRRS